MTQSPGGQVELVPFHKAKDIRDATAAEAGERAREGRGERCEHHCEQRKGRGKIRYSVFSTIVGR